MNIGEVIINRVTKHNIKLSTIERTQKYFSGNGYPYYYGFVGGEQGTEWWMDFMADSKLYKYDIRKDKRIHATGDYQFYIKTLKERV